MAHPLRPFVAAAENSLLGAARGPSGFPGVDIAPVWAGVADTLARRLVTISARVLCHELAHARSVGALRGGDPRARFADFLTTLASRASLADLLARYPVLAELLSDECHNTVAALGELLLRLDGDREALASTLLGDLAGARLVAVEFGAGDRHGGGRSVTVLRFTGGHRLVYKPRPLGIHEAWNALLGWLHSVRPDIAPRGAAVLARPGYGWMEFVAPAPCRGRDQVELFYRRQGALLALCYVLDAVDMHCENLVASGDQPILIDIETLFHPAWRPETDIGDDPALTALNDSVARTGILPWPIPGVAGTGETLDISAFGAWHDQHAPDADAGWVDPGTDTMRVAPRSLSAPRGDNRPTLGDTEVDPLEYADALDAGFVAGYHALLADRARLAGPGGPLAGFAGLQTRIVVRATRVYAGLLADATEPDALASRAARSAAFAELADVAGFSWQHALVDRERTELMAGDIPLLTARTDATRVGTAGGEPLPLELDRTGMQRVNEKLLRMDLADLRTQRWMISALLAAKATGRSPGRPVPRAVTQPLDRTALLALACGIGNELISVSFCDRNRINWLGLESRDCRQWTVMQLGAGLADGYPGVALFLAQLAELTGLHRYASVAAEAVRPLPRLVAAMAEHRELARDVGPGGMFGLGGVAYALARLGALLDDPALRAAVPVALDALEATIGDTDASFGSGLAGGLTALRAVGTETGEPRAAALGRRIAARIRGTTARSGGFLDGAAGVRWAAGLAPVPLATSAGAGWSNGLAGAALAASAAADGETTVRAFLDAARERPAMPDQSLCHGVSGVVDVLVELAGAGDAGAKQALDLVGGRLLGAVAQQGTRCGTRNGVPTPGLLHGTAGIGYALLRLAYGNQVPSVLTLQPGGAAHGSDPEKLGRRSTGGAGKEVPTNRERT